MAPSLRSSRSPVILAALLLSLTLTWTPGTYAQEASPTSAACADSGTPLHDEEFPDGVVREEVLGQAPTLDDAGAETDTVVAASIVCIDPGTHVEIEMLTPGTFTTEIPHPYTTTFTVTDGELQVRLVHACVPDAAGGTCPENPESSAAYFLHGSLTTKQSFPTGGGDGAWVTLTPGDVVVLDQVTVEYQTPADHHARILVSGAYRAVDGGACPARCWTP